MHERKDIQGMHILDGKWEKILGQDPGSRGIYIETFTKKKQEHQRFLSCISPIWEDLCMDFEEKREPCCDPVW